MLYRNVSSLLTLWGVISHKTELLNKMSSSHHKRRNIHLKMFCLQNGLYRVRVVPLSQSTFFLWDHNITLLLGYMLFHPFCVRGQFHFYNTPYRPPRWSSGQSSWLQIQRSVFDSWYYQIFWGVSLERSPLSLVSTIEDLLGRKNSGSGPENRE
jgi:hypothetical protein